MARPGLAVLIPAYNEAESIFAVVRSVSAFCDRVLLVDDGSHDGTAAKAEAAGALVLRRRNSGYEGALEAGFQYLVAEGAYKFCITIDADGQHYPSLIPAYRRRLMQGAHLVVGFRPRPARLGEWLFLISGICIAGVRDPMCGMKGYNLSSIRERGTWDPTPTVGASFVHWSARRGKDIAQAPCPIRERIHGKARFGWGWKANRKLFTAWFRFFLSR
jgi:glycosyltransferase involved in cell wall biosynthesis